MDIGSHHIVGVGILAICLGLGACTPSPQKVCDHANGLMNTGGTRTAEQTARGQADCIRELTTVQQQHPAEYKVAAKCMMDATTREATVACMLPLIAFIQH